MTKPRTLLAADLFCGAGGTSSGLYKAAHNTGYDEVKLIAINHWDVAIATHSANHPGAEHLCESLDNVDPRKAVPGGYLNLMVASPECTHHSVARGGKPINDQSRASAWHICRWAEALYIENILIENVPEFLSWGPIGYNGRPLQSKKGALFHNFIDALKALNYTVDHRLLNAADYGDATSRVRLFIIATRKRKRIEWPEPTHTPDGRRTLFGPTVKWRPAREIIDWELKGKSIFDRRKPLAPKTLKRLAAGARKFWGIDLEPFLVMMYGTNDARSLDKPLPTVTANGKHIALAEPFLIPQFSDHAPRSVDRPLNTLTTTSRGITLCEAQLEPFTLQQQSGGVARPASKPLPTIATKGAISLTEGFLIPFFGERAGQEPRTHSVDEPLPAVTSHGAGALAEPFLVVMKGQSNSASIQQPLPTTTTKSHLGLAEPFIQKYYGTGITKSVEDPLDAVTTKDRFGLVTPIIIERDGQRYFLDIRLRMLQNHELAAAQGFDRGYQFQGNKSQQTKQIGNAVPVTLATRLVESLLQ